MPFNSYQFIFLFLPIVVLGYHGARKWLGHRAALAWLLAGSVGFYAFSRIDSLLVLVPSILLDYAIGRSLVACGDDPRLARRKALLLAGGIAANLAFLGYFKYWNFFLETSNDLLGTGFRPEMVLLPLGISFITFQKIAYLLDSDAGLVRKVSLGEYLLFVLFFPRVVAGPIVHHAEVMPQLLDPARRPVARDLVVGLCLFGMGLFKKSFLADGVAQFVTPVFDAPVGSPAPTFTTAWIAALAYTFQIYFDFSGYSDMATGIARFFGVRLPVNFNSPLKSSSIVEFWSRWHITLTRFLTAYVYTPVVVALTRRRAAAGIPILRGKKSQVSAILVLVGVPTLFTMTLSGFWHGAGFQFIVWGVLHGVMLTINQGWRMLRPRFWKDEASYVRVMRPMGFALTFLGVTLTFVLFRANSIDSALQILGSMSGQHGITLPKAFQFAMGPLAPLLEAVGVTFDWSSGSRFLAGIAWITMLFLVALLLPNSLELLRRHEPVAGFGEAAEAGADPGRRSVGGWIKSLDLAASRAGPWLVAALFLAGVLGLQRAGGFLYWKF